jgi:hypothetical protein
MRALDGNMQFSVVTLLSKFGRPGRFHPNPQPRGFQSAAVEASSRRLRLSLL